MSKTLRRNFSLVWRVVKYGLLALVLFWGLTILAGFVAPPISTLMWKRFLTLQPVTRQALPLREISPNLIAAVVMSEDGQFCRHHGVDWEAMNLVLDHENGPNRGASTLSMQVAKNMLLWPGRSYLRKALEIPLAMILDVLWGKKRIISAYLNIAEWGPGTFGAEAAAKLHFNKSARSLNPHEAALLASSLPNPFLRNPRHPGRHQLILANIIQARMGESEEWLDCLR